MSESHRFIMFEIVEAMAVRGSGGEVSVFVIPEFLSWGPMI